MSIDGKRPLGGSGSGNNGNSPPHKKGRTEEVPMEVDDSDEEVTTPSQQAPLMSPPSTTASVPPAASSVPQDPSTAPQAGSSADEAVSSVPQDPSNVPQAGGSTDSAGGDVGAATGSVAIAGAQDVEQSAQKERRMLVARKGGARPKTQQHEYKTYSDSVVDQDVGMKPLPAKPAVFLPSNQSLQKQDDVQDQPMQNQPQQAGEGAQASPAHAPAPEPSAQITIDYPDGRQEVISVMNPDDVWRVARAGQVMKPLTSRLSSSHPQTSQPHQASTSSLPASLSAPSGVPASLAAGQGEPDAVSDPQLPQAQQVQPPVAGNVNISGSAADPNVPSDDHGQKRAGDNHGTYQSHSAPTLTESESRSTTEEGTQLFSTPLLSMTKKLKKKVVTTLELLDMKAELDKISSHLRVIQEESSLSDEKKGDKDSDKKDDKKDDKD